MSVTEFLKSHWNQKPLLIKEAFDPCQLPSRDDFLELLTLDQVESRAVIKKSPKKEILDGPFTSAQLMELEKKRTTYLVHNLQCESDIFEELLSHFSFLPEFEFDDLMASVSKKDSTLDAHIDDYNVFIYQGQGLRRWQLQLDPDIALNETEDLKTLKHFICDEEHILEPGDLLYIPKGVAHYGHSLTDGISYSIGLKAIANHDLVKDYLSELLIDGDQGVRTLFESNESIISADSQEVTALAIKHMKEMIIKDINNEEAMDLALLKTLSQGRNFEADSLETNPGEYSLSPHYKMVYFKKSKHVILGINGESFKISIPEWNKLIFLNQRRYSKINVSKEVLNSSIVQYLFERGLLERANH